MRTPQQKETQPILGGSLLDARLHLRR